MKCVCKNKDCKRYGKVDFYPTTTYRLVNGELVSDDIRCPSCGEVREEINDNAKIPLSEKNVGIGQYTMASPDEKREMLKRRSHEHFEKEVKPFKEYQINEAMRQFKGK